MQRMLSIIFLHFSIEQDVLDRHFRSIPGGTYNFKNRKALKELFFSQYTNMLYKPAARLGT